MGKWRRPLLVVLLVPLLAAAAFGMDVVTMVDTSASMFPYYEELQNYLLRDLLESWLHTGDGFHLLSFADTPETEITAKVAGARELTEIIERIYLLRPLGRYTDLVAALDYLYDYLDGLPADSPKLVLLLTDGIHDPPPDSPNRGDASQVLDALRRNADRIRQRGWDIHILRIPGAVAGSPQSPAVSGLAAIEQGAAPSRQAGQAGAAGGTAGPGPGAAAAGGDSTVSGQTAPGAVWAAEPGAAATTPAGGTAEEGPANLLEEFAERTGSSILPYGDSTPETLTELLTGFPTLTFPGNLGEVGRRFTVPLLVHNPGQAERRLTLVGLASGRASLLLHPAAATIPPGQSAVLQAEVRLPRALLPGEHTLPIALRFAEPEVRVSPLSGELSFNYLGGGAISPVLLYLLIAAGALVVLAAAVIWLLSLIRNRARDRSYQRVFGQGRPGQRRLILKVLDQNPNIGTRNIHEVPRGRSRSVGGDGSTFLIYYLPMPPRIADIRNDGQRYIFIPRKPQYFASLDKPLAGCLNQEIVALTRRGQRVRLLFQEYVSPLESINNLMRSVRQVRAQSASSTA